jgi:hypothetical protein
MAMYPADDCFFIFLAVRMTILESAQPAVSSGLFPKARA